MNLKSFQEKIITQVQNEYKKGYDHIRDERERKRDILKKYMNPIIPEGEVRINLLWRNVQLELALFLNDEIGVRYLSSDGILGEQIMENANKVAKYDDIDMKMRAQRELIVSHNALYGLAVTVIDGWDDTEKQPINDVIDPLAIIIDPQNHSGSNMRFFGIERKVSKEWLKSATGFEEVNDIGFSSQQLDDNKRASDTANNLQFITTDEDMVAIYDHFMVYDGKKYLTTWANDRNILIRVMEIGALTEAEKRKPSKISFPVQLHRRKPKFGSVYGVSIADEVLQYQDAISKLTNLNLIQARKIALGSDLYMDERIGVDTAQLATKQVGGRIIPVSNDSGIPTQNLIFEHNTQAPNPFIDSMIAQLEGRSEGTTNVTQQSFGVSQAGSQTKAEIQTLQQNTNQILMWISQNYMDGQKEYWLAHYRSYCLNFSKKSKKVISFFQKGNATSLTLKKDDFIADGKVNVFITSKAQDSIENDKEFNKLLSIASLYLQNMKPGYGMNDFLRLLGKKTNIRDFDEYRYIQQTPEEMEAMEGLTLLNNNKEVSAPRPGQDYMTYIQIYKQAIDTPAKYKALIQFEEAYIAFQKPQEDMMAGQGDKATSGMAMNNLSNNSTPSIQNVTQS